LGREAQKALAGAARVFEHPGRTLIAEQGAPVFGVGCIVRGLVRCWQVDVDGNEYTVETAWSGSISMVGLGGPGTEWPWTVTTVVPTMLVGIPWEALAAVRRRYAIDDVLMKHTAAEFGRRQTWHGVLRSVRLRRRLRMILRRMGDEFGEPSAAGIRLDFPVTQNDLAALASVTRDEVGRVMRKLAADGLVKPIGRRGLLIPDLDSLGSPVELP
jgi:CRP-like cAMP-binding protein